MWSVRRINDGEVRAVKIIKKALIKNSEAAHKLSSEVETLKALVSGLLKE